MAMGRRSTHRQSPLFVSAADLPQDRWGRGGHFASKRFNLFNTGLDRFTLHAHLLSFGAGGGAGLHFCLRER